MSYTRHACDTWTVQATFAVERLNSTIEELAEFYGSTPSLILDPVLTALRVLRNELLSALQNHRLAHMTALPTCGPTKLKNISRDTLEAIEVGALVIVQGMKTLAEAGREIRSDEFDHSADGDCPYCMRLDDDSDCDREDSGA